MPRGLGRLPFLHHRGAGRDAVARVDALPPRPIDLDDQPVGPPRLLPSAIIRQILFEATELTPGWALPRATTTAAIVASPAGNAKPAKRTRRTPSGASTKRASSPEPSPSGDGGTSGADEASPRRPSPRATRARRPKTGA